MQTDMCTTKTSQITGVKSTGRWVKAFQRTRQKHQMNARQQHTDLQKPLTRRYWKSIANASRTWNGSTEVNGNGIRHWELVRSTTPQSERYDITVWKAWYHSLEGMTSQPERYDITVWKVRHCKSDKYMTLQSERYDIWIWKVRIILVWHRKLRSTLPERKTTHQRRQWIRNNKHIHMD